MRSIAEKINSLIIGGEFAKATQFIAEVRDSLDPRVAERYLQYCRFKENARSHIFSSFELGSERNCVCLNITLNELAKLENLFRIWLGLHKQRETRRPYFPHLVIAFDNYDEGKIAETQALLRKYRINEIFLSIRVLTVSVPVKFNFYRREVDGSLDLDACIYGYKSGPNFQFFALMKILMTDGYEFVYLCETDTFPLHNNWANSFLTKLGVKTLFGFWEVRFSGARNYIRLSPYI